MDPSHFFFSSVVDLKDHRLSRQNMEAMYAVHHACDAIKDLEQFGPSVHKIMIDAIHQDYASKFHKPELIYDPEDKTISAGLKVDLEKVLAADFFETVNIYRDLIFEVLDQVKDRVRDYNFEGLKADLQEAIRNEIEVTK